MTGNCCMQGESPPVIKAANSAGGERNTGLTPHLKCFSENYSGEKGSALWPSPKCEHTAPELKTSPACLSSSAVGTGLPKVRRCCRADRCTRLPRAMVQKYRNLPGKERPTCNTASSRTVQRQLQEQHLGFPESKKQQRSIRKKTYCSKDKIPPLVSPLVAKCQGLGKFSLVLGS